MLTSTNCILRVTKIGMIVTIIIHVGAYRSQYNEIEIVLPILIRFRSTLIPYHHRFIGSNISEFIIIHVNFNEFTLIKITVN